MGIPLRQQIRIGAYLLRKEILGPKRYPMVLMLEPLFRCNLACAGCGKIDYPDAILNQRLSVDECLQAVDDCGARLAQVPEFQALPEDRRAEVLRRLQTHKAELNAISSIALLRDRSRGAQTQLLPDMLSQVARLTPAPAPAAPGFAEPPGSAPQPPEYIAAAALRVAWPGAYLAEEQDVDRYVGELRKLLLAEIRKGKRVTV